MHRERIGAPEGGEGAQERARDIAARQQGEMSRQTRADDFAGRFIFLQLMHDVRGRGQRASGGLDDAGADFLPEAAEAIIARVGLCPQCPVRVVEGQLA